MRKGICLNLRFIIPFSFILLSALISCSSSIDEITLADLNEELATIAFDCSYDPENKTVTGGLSSFGHCPSYPNTHVLAIYVTLADGSLWEYTFDVTEQVHESADPYNIKIVLEWGNIDININM